MFGKSVRRALPLLAAGGDGVHRRSLSRHDGHGTAAWAATEGSPPSASGDQNGDRVELLHRHRRLARGSQDHLRSGQAERSVVGDPGHGSGRPGAARCPQDAGRGQSHRKAAARHGNQEDRRSAPAGCRLAQGTFWRMGAGHGRQGARRRRRRLVRRRDRGRCRGQIHQPRTYLRRRCAQAGPARVNPAAPVRDGRTQTPGTLAPCPHAATQAALCRFLHHHPRSYSAGLDAARQ